MCPLQGARQLPGNLRTTSRAHLSHPPLEICSLQTMPFRSAHSEFKTSSVAASGNNAGTGSCEEIVSRPNNGIALVSSLCRLRV